MVTPHALLAAVSSVPTPKAWLTFFAAALEETQDEATALRVADVLYKLESTKRRLMPPLRKLARPMQYAKPRGKWQAFTTKKNTVGAYNPETGERVYGAKAKRLLEGAAANVQPEEHETPHLNPLAFLDGEHTDEKIVGIAAKEYAEKGTRSTFFKNWFGDWEQDPANASQAINPKTGEPDKTAQYSRAVDEDGEPIIVYHGTTHEFDRFDPSKAFQLNHLGQGFYFSSSEGDSEINYAGIGPDLRNRIGELADEYIAFDPKQIKRVNNRGTFDPSTDRLDYAAPWAPFTTEENTLGAYNTETGDREYGEEARKRLATPMRAPREFRAAKQKKEKEKTFAPGVSVKTEGGDTWEVLAVQGDKVTLQTGNGQMVLPMKTAKGLLTPITKEAVTAGNELTDYALGAHKEFWNKLPWKPKYCVRAYQDKGDVYDKINVGLRVSKGEVPKGEVEGLPYKELVAGIDQVVNTATVPDDLVAYRGASLKLLGKLAKSPDKAIGKVLTDHGFVSTSLNQKKAEDFSRGMLVEIRVPAGSHGFFMATTGSDYSSAESELLLPRGAKFGVVDVQKVGGGGKVQWHLTVELIQQNPVGTSDSSGTKTTSTSPTPTPTLTTSPS